ncbi:hypothetical protein DHEL01_v204641 [Diaporthe helianthi]|uniref:Uncharacterized protein n=1 Tax=Diaporthe helianthi TaxID=158607 RepID=A0A2P5I3B5_DIAHE|nr:hypothetical protein DHEL01_v204641 [Diaporthe helianthi]
MGTRAPGHRDCCHAIRGKALRKLRMGVGTIAPQTRSVRRIGGKEKGWDGMIVVDGRCTPDKKPIEGDGELENWNPGAVIDRFRRGREAARDKGVANFRNKLSFRTAGLQDCRTAGQGAKPERVPRLSGPVTARSVSWARTQQPQETPGTDASA